MLVTWAKEEQRERVEFFISHTQLFSMMDNYQHYLSVYCNSSSTLTRDMQSEEAKEQCDII